MFNIKKMELACYNATDARLLANDRYETAMGIAKHVSFRNLRIILSFVDFASHLLRDKSEFAAKLRKCLQKSGMGLCGLFTAVGMVKHRKKELDSLYQSEELSTLLFDYVWQTGYQELLDANSTGLSWILPDMYSLWDEVKITEHGSPSRSYPVDGDSAAFASNQRWEGEGAAARLRLLTFCEAKIMDFALPTLRRGKSFTNPDLANKTPYSTGYRAKKPTWLGHEGRALFKAMLSR